MSPTPDQFLIAYQGLADTKSEVAHAEQVATEARRELAQQEAYAITKGEIEGKNAEQRKANLALMLSGWYDDAQNAEDALQEAKLAYELAAIEVNSLRYQLRAAEVMARFEGDAA